MKNLIKTLLFACSVLLSQGANAQCNIPTNAIASYSNNVTSLNWDAVPGALEYQIEIKLPGYSWTYPEIVTTSPTNSLVFTGVMHSITFDWRVRTHCSVDSSGWQEQQFTLPCPEPSALIATNITSTSATLNWSPQPGYNTTVSDFALAYRVLGSTGSWTSLGRTSDTTLNVSGLTPGVTYEWCVNQTCPYFYSSPVISTFTTLLPACGIPNNLSASNIGSTTATIDWDAIAGASSYTLQFKKTSASLWNSITNLSSNTYSMSNLSVNESYDYKVKSTCNAATSAYSTIASFNTSGVICQSAGDNSYEWINRFNVGSINRYSGAEAGGYVNTNMMTSLQIGSNRNRGEIRAGFAGSSRYQNFSVYIDFNGNGDYSDPGERVEGSTLISSSNTVKFKFDIPNNVSPGVVGMRVIMQKNGSTPINGCLNNFIGETEDYLVNLYNSSNRMANPAIIANTDMDQNFVVYPNPSSGKFSVTIPENIVGTKFEVLSLDGKTILKQTVEIKEHFQFDLGAYPQGVYILNIVDESGEKHIFRLIKE